MSDTPITDKHEESGEVPASVCRRLERENVGLRGVIADLLDNHDKVYAHERWACVEQAAQRARTFLKS